MLSKFSFAPSADMLSTAVLAWDIGDVAVTNFMPITDIQFEYNRDSVRRPKMEMTGSWNGFQKINEILVHVNFDIFDTSTANFNARKRTLQNSFSPANPSVKLNVEACGVLTLRFDGDTEDVSAPVTLDGDIATPFSGPMLSNATMTMVIGQGYMTGVSSGGIYYPR